MAMQGRQKHKDRLKLLANATRVEKIVGRTLYAAADLIRADAHKSISAGSVSGKRHQPSKAGEPPHRDTGHLQAHLIAVLVNPGEAQVRSEADYAAALEFGTSRMSARPYMRPARDRNEGAINRMYKEHIDQFIKRSGR